MKSITKLLVGGVLVVTTGGLIYAQPAGDVGGDVSISATGEKKAVLSPEEMSASAESLMSMMRGHLRHVTQLRDKATAEKDIIKLNCINDKLMPLKAQMNLADVAHRSLTDAIAAGNDDARYSAYADLTINNDKVKDLRDEADACVGDALTYVGKTDVQVTGPDNPLVPGDDGFGEGIEPPVYRTPFD